MERRKKRQEDPPDQGWVVVGGDDADEELAMRLQMEEQERMGDGMGEDEDEALARRLQMEEDGKRTQNNNGEGPIPMPMPVASQPLLGDGGMMSSLIEAMTRGFGQHLGQLMPTRMNSTVEQQRQRRQRFSHVFQVYSPTVAGSTSASTINHSDKILLPAVSLHELSERGMLNDSAGGRAGSPTLFRLTSKDSDGTVRTVHGGVLEFTAPSACVVIPVWMMDHLAVDEGAMVTVESCALPLGTSIKLRPVNYAEFKMLQNPKALLESALSQNFFTLTKGTTITLAFQSTDYIFEVVDTQPADAVSILNTDVETHFDLPEDYFESVLEDQPPEADKAANSNVPVQPLGRSLANEDQVAGPGTRECTNCGKFVSEANYERHVAFCERNLVRCSECGERLKKADEAAHYEALHVPVTCECGVVCPKDMMATHKEFECEKRPVLCEYCQLEFPSAEHAKHVRDCGARTERCALCREYVMLRDMTEHQASGCAYKSNKTKHKCSMCATTCATEEELSHHFIEAHTEEGMQRQMQRQQRETEALLEAMGARFACTQCGISFPMPSALQAHNRVYHSGADMLDLSGSEFDDAHLGISHSSDDER